jgi:hypothetical protein
MSRNPFGLTPEQHARLTEQERAHLPPEERARLSTEPYASDMSSFTNAW